MSDDARLRRRPTGFGTCLFTLSVLGWMACAAPPTPQDVIVLGLGDLEPSTLDALTDPGTDLPNFRRLAREGAAGPLTVHLESVPEPQSASTAGLWTTVATGRADHGVGTSMDRPATSHGLQVPALWHRVSAADQRVAVVGWPGTWPVNDVAGQMVSQHAFLDAQAIQHATRGLTVEPTLPHTVHPASLEASLRDPLAGLDLEDDNPEDDPYLAAARSFYTEATGTSRRPDLLMLYRPALSARQADRLLGDLLANTGTTARLLIIALPRPEAPASGHVFMWGSGVQSSASLLEGHLDGVVPTVLTWLGIPLPSDLPGKVFEEAWASPPILTHVDSHDPALGVNGASTSEGLPRVGFLRGFPKFSPDEPRASKDTAHLARLTGRADQAETIYRRLLTASPNDAVLHRHLAAVLGAQERYDEAMASIEQALALDPLQPAAYHHRARLSELMGNNRQAYVDYKSALLFEPRLNAAEQGLERLGVSPLLHRPSNSEEKEAARLIQRALEATRVQDYDHALELLEQAEDAAPPYVVTYHVRANVYYLKGKIKEAIKALELALVVEPDNALFSQNLKRLKAEPPRKPPKSKR